MDFSKVKQWGVPEGDVQAVYSNSEIIWHKETTVKVSGTWQFNETPTLTPMEEETDTLAHWYPPNYDMPFDDCYKIVVTDTKIVFECGEVGREEEHNTIYSTSGGWKDAMARVFSFNGTQVVSKQFYDWLTANAKKVYDEMVACLEGKWKFSPTPDIDSIEPNDDVFVYEIGIVDNEGFYARGSVSGERYVFGSIKVYRDAWGDFVMSYDGAPASTVSEIKVYYVPSTELVWKSDYWRTIDFLEGRFIDYRFWEWMVGWVGTQNAMPVADEEQEPWG